MARYWFRPHDYGYGAMPVTWQGWALTLAIAAVIGAMTTGLASFGRNHVAVLVPYLIVALALFTVLLIVAKRKTEGAWRWRWGRERN